MIPKSVVMDFEKIFPSISEIGIGPVISCKHNILDDIRNYYIAEPYVTIIWKNGKKTQTIVDCDDKFDKELGFMLAVYKYHRLYIENYSKTKYKKELSCIKGSKLYDYLFIRFKEFTSMDTNEAHKYLENLKVTENKRKKSKQIENKQVKKKRKKVFKKELFWKDQDMYDDAWVYKADRKEVVGDHTINGYGVLDEWCEIVEE